MKKKIAMLMLALALVFTACDNKAAGDSADTKEAKDVDVVALLSEVQEKSTDIKSLSMDMKTSQTMTMPAMGEATEAEPTSMTMDTDVKMDMIVDPLAAYLNMSMMAPAGLTGSTEPIKMEMYMTAENVYMQMPTELTEGGSSWVKMNMQDLAGMNIDPEQMKNSMNSSQAFEALKELKDDLTVTDQGDTYLVTFKGSGEKAQKLFDAQLEASGNSASLEGAELTFNEIDYQYVISKETSLPVSLKANMDYAIGMGDGSIPIVQTIDGTFSKINEIDKIEIPQEALDATEMEVPDTSLTPETTEAP